MDAQEYTPYKDVTRPIFHRGPGQIGLYILILDIEPEDPKQYGSQKFMWQDLSDKLLAYLQEKELYEIKIALEEERLMKGVVLDGFKSGLLLAVSCDTVAACDVIDKELKAGKIQTFLKSRIETRETMKHLRTTKLEVRVSHYDDEIVSCKNDFVGRSTIPKVIADEAYDCKVLRVARKLQQNYTKELYKLRDDQIKFEASLGEFLNLAKTYLPAGINEFKTMADFEKLVKRAKDRKAANVAILDHYGHSIGRVRAGARTLLGVLRVLAQVHAGSENERQRKLKATINHEIEEVLSFLTANYDFSKTVHVTWAAKVMLVERNMFNGLVSFLPLCIDKVIDADHALDDYYDEFKIDLSH